VQAPPITGAVVAVIFAVVEAVAGAAVAVVYGMHPMVADPIMYP
jgi:hypothetical protein